MAAALRVYLQLTNRGCSTEAKPSRSPASRGHGPRARRTGGPVMSQPASPQFTDPKNAKAQAKAEKAYRKASRPFYKKKRFILLASLP